MNIVTQLHQKLNRKPTAQEIQDEIFRQTPEKKIKLEQQMMEFAKELSGHRGENVILTEFNLYKTNLSSKHIENIKYIAKAFGKYLDKKYLLEQSRKQETWD